MSDSLKKNLETAVKWGVLTAFPAIAVAWLALAPVWGVPSPLVLKIAATIVGIDGLCGTLAGLKTDDLAQALADAKKMQDAAQAGADGGVVVATAASESSAAEKPADSAQKPAQIASAPVQKQIEAAPATTAPGTPIAPAEPSVAPTATPIATEPAEPATAPAEAPVAPTPAEATTAPTEELPSTAAVSVGGDAK